MSSDYIRPLLGGLTIKAHATYNVDAVQSFHPKDRGFYSHHFQSSALKPTYSIKRIIPQLSAIPAKLNMLFGALL